MLKKVRIEVETDTAEQAVLELDKYEHTLQTAEAERFCLGNQDDWQLLPWCTGMEWRRFHNEELGRKVTDEVIAMIQGGGAFRGRRVVQYMRLDTRGGYPGSGLEALFRNGWTPKWGENERVLRLDWDPDPKVLADAEARDCTCHEVESGPGFEGCPVHDPDPVVTPKGREQDVPEKQAERRERNLAAIEAGDATYD